MKARLIYPISLIILLALGACAAPQAPVTPVPPGTPADIIPSRAPTAVQPPATSQPQGSAAASFFARPGGGAGPLVAYSLATGAVRFSLPAGRLSADGQHYYAATPSAANTLLNAYDLSTGTGKLNTSAPGQWELSAVSANGRWAALTRLFDPAQKAQWTANSWHTELQVIDTRTRQPARALHLDGNFEVDGLSNQGDSLYLIQYLPAVKPDHYQVRLYDLDKLALQDGALVDKRAAGEVMVGERWQAVASPDGQWLLSLYLRTANGSAFIHALNLENRYTLCIDLPSAAGGLEQLNYYTLALAPDGRTIYAPNAALGTIARVSLDDLNVTQAAKFQPVASATAYNPQTPARTIVAPDERAVYFTNGTQAWAFNVQSGTVSPLVTSAPIIGLDLSRDGKRLYVARLDQSPLVLDAASGQALSFQAAGASSQ